MTTRTKVLQELEKNRNTHISGEKLGTSLDISRAAVHKAIKELREEGYDISAVSNKGYCLSEESDVVSPQGISMHLKKNKGSKILVFKTLNSTNKKAKELAAEGAESGTIVIANEQTEGRGRLGRSFYSPADTGIYLSLIIRPNVKAQKGVLITTFASVAVCRAIESVFGLQCEIKWVNDVLLNKRKICGILTEGITDFETGNLEHVILGIGVNFTTENFPDDIKNKAGSIQNTENKHIIRNKFIAELIDQLADITQEIQNGIFIEEYKNRSAALGKEIEVLGHENIRYGKAIDIDESGGLVISLENGENEILNSGEISIKGDFYD